MAIDETTGKCKAEPEQGCDGYCCSIHGCCDEAVEDGFCQKHYNLLQNDNEYYLDHYDDER
jgi:hypothetical protein